METRHRKQAFLAQNFLKSPKLVRRLVRMSGISLSDMVYEIGPGTGVITAALASVAGYVTAIEKDPELVRRLRVRFSQVRNVQIVQKDFLDYSFVDRSSTNRTLMSVSQYKIFGNIPYNRTAQILRKILDERSGLCEAFLIMQQEPAKKFSGYPRESLFSILTKPFFDLQLLSKLNRNDFRPAPNVDSVFLSIKRRRKALINAEDVALYREFVRYGFSRWKPNLRLAFKDIFTYRQWKRLAHDLNFSLNATPTELSVEQWLGLYASFKSRTLVAQRR
jgi:23S rRNA (adenine-N6)-dimethyltransferase